MTHTAKVRALRQWTRNTQRYNQQAAERRERYHNLILAERVCDNILDSQFIAKLQKVRDYLFREAVGCLVEGIDPLPLPTVSDMNTH